MRARKRRVLSFLRSPRLAAWLLAGITLYVVIPTVIPMGAADSPKVAEWAAKHPAAERVVAATGMHQPYTRPWFIAAAALLTASTAVCAFDRTRTSMAQWRRAGVVSESLAERLHSSPTVRVEVPEGEAITREAMLDIVADTLRASRMRVTRGPVMVAAWKSRGALLGSPVFHWALVLLFFVAAAGQLTRFEGILGAAVGGNERIDTQASYLQAESGPLFFSRFTGVSFKVTKADPQLVIGGIDRGWTPWVEVRVRGRLVKSQWVHPNSPLRQGPLLVHRELPQPLMLVRLSSGEESRTEELFFRKIGESPVMPLVRTLETPSGAYVVRFDPRPAEQVAISVQAPGAKRFSTEQVVGLGEEARLPAGFTLEPVSIGQYAPLRVQNDWSVIWIYIAFVLGSFSAALAVFFPPRMVWAMAIESEGRWAIHVVTAQRKMDPGFPGMVRRKLEDAVGVERSEETGEA